MDPGRAGTPGRDEPDVKTVAVMFDPELISDAGDRARIIAVSPLIREMMVYALRWPIDRPDGTTSPTASSARWPPVSEALDHEAPLSLPTSRPPDRRRGDGLHQGAPRLGYGRRGQPRGLGVGTDAAAAVPGHARPVLADLPAACPDAAGHGPARRPGQSVQETSTAVGFDSLSSFTRASPSSAARPRRLPQKGCGRADCLAGLPEQPFAQQRVHRDLPPPELIGRGNGSARCRSTWGRRLMAPSARTCILMAAQGRSMSARVSPRSARCSHRAAPTPRSGCRRWSTPSGLPSTSARPT